MIRMSKGASTKWELKRKRGFKEFFISYFKEFFIIACIAPAYLIFKESTLVEGLLFILVIFASATLTATLLSLLVWFIQEIRYKYRVLH